MGRLSIEEIKRMMREIVREELDNTRIELPDHTHEEPEQFDNCPECDGKLSLKTKPKYCPSCGAGELDYET